MGRQNGTQYSSILLIADLVNMKDDVVLVAGWPASTNPENISII